MSDLHRSGLVTCLLENDTENIKWNISVSCTEFQYRKRNSSEQISIARVFRLLKEEEESEWNQRDFRSVDDLNGS